MFWVDEKINEILTRDEKKYLITDYKTPSGTIHVGALRGVIIHDVLYRGLKDKKHEVENWYGFDDFDPMDGLSENLKEKYSKYMGMPLCHIPSPEPGYENFARYFASSFIKAFQKMGVDAKIIWGSELYKNGVYNKAIEIVLNNAARIREIYKEVSGGVKPDDWYPLNVVCPNCGKIGTTKVFGWDGHEVEYICEENMVEWARGCGHTGKISPFDGNSKMPYKVETPSKWFTFGTSVELAGKDHYTKGGSFDIAKTIAREIFKIEPAYGFGYEWFLVGGRKMSSSKGIGATTEEISAILSPEILRFLMVRTQAKRAIDFDVNGDTIPLLYDEYDRCLNEYIENPEADLARAYFYTEKKIDEVILKYRMRFSRVAHLLQMPKIDVLTLAEEEKGSPLTEAEKNEIQSRIETAQEWLKEFAPDSAKFTVQKDLPEVAKNLSDAQKTYLNKIAEAISAQEKWTGEGLHAKIHEIKNEMQIEPKQAFSAIYLSFLGKDSGPQAGWLLASLDQKFVINRLKEV